MKGFRHISLISLIGLALVFASCSKEKVAGNGSVISTERDVKNFYNVHVFGNTTVDISGGASFGVTVSGYENLLPHLETRVEDGTLMIRFDDKVVVSNDNTEVHVVMPSLVSLISEGSGGLTVKGPFVNPDVLSIQKTGLGDIQVSNVTANSFKLLLNGNSNFNGFGLSCNTAIVTLNGNGNVELTVANNLNTTINGNGIIYYKGDPEVKTNITGNGQVVKK